MYAFKHSLFLTFTLICSGLTLAAAQIDSVVLTASGSNTIFQITGTFGSDAPVTDYSSPNTAYLLSFSTPTAPTSFENLGDEESPFFQLSTTATLNGVVFSGTGAAFYPDEQGGGLEVCVGILCNAEGIVRYVTFDIYGSQLFTGPFYNPVFIEGSTRVDQNSEFGSTQIYYATPEPTPTVLVSIGAGFIGLATHRRRHAQRLKKSSGPNDFNAAA